MDVTPSPRAEALRSELLRFFDQHIHPNEQRFHEEVEENRRAGNPWRTSALIETLKPLARARGLWNLFLPASERVPEGLGNFDYAPLAEIMGRVFWAAEVFNCSAPDTGNMEILERYGSDAQKTRWLDPLLAGEIRSAFLMTEPAVASSDATNIRCSIRRESGDYVIDGRKWFATGAGDPRCALYVVLGRTDPEAPRHRQQSMLLVPADAPGVRVLRPVPVFGYDHAPHGHMEIELVDVRVPLDSVLLGEGRGFEIAQGRLGPGRIHHCMRQIGMAERAMALMCRRLSTRVAFGRAIADLGGWRERIGEARCLIEQARLLTLKAAHMMDTVGNKAARTEIAMIKAVVPTMTAKVVDWAIQAHGGGGISDDFVLAAAYADARALRLADGPDEVHLDTIARWELAKHAAPAAA
ncbi:MAG TPA: acyl-CoA dehydrogenase family protein [Xanthomonadaceae bacterium]|nr:acyl-CoA dehydrogenase family protein [Xanthomonadaceae bacterium]